MVRIVETTDGIQDTHLIQKYDKMLRGICDNGWLEDMLNTMFNNNLNRGNALEIGTGPGYFGLEWVKATSDTTLIGIEISEGMIEVATKNRKEYGFEDRVKYYHGDASKMNFDNECFDLIFTVHSLHEWANPLAVLFEMHRLLKEGGYAFIVDLRRDAQEDVMKKRIDSMQDEDMKEGYINSFNAAYTRKEMIELLSKTDLKIIFCTETPIDVYTVVKK